MKLSATTSKFATTYYTIYNQQERASTQQEETFGTTH